MNVIDAKCVIEVGLPNQWEIGENITGTPKFQNNKGAVKLFFQYCDSNIGFFSIAPYEVIVILVLSFFSLLLFL